MNFIRVSLTFNPEIVNRSRKGQYGAWRVIGCNEIDEDVGVKVYSFSTSSLPTTKVMSMTVAKRYRKGVIVDPLKLLKNYLAVRGMFEADDQTINSGKLSAYPMML